MKQEKIIFDLDPGVDDTMALLVAFNDPKIDVKLITITFGNVGLKQATKNACFVVQNFAKKDYPIYYGADRALKAPTHDAFDVHGRTGLGTHIVAENITKRPSNKPDYGAAEAMRDTIMANPGEIVIVSVGPVTNVATLFKKYPKVIKYIKKIVLMVGSMDGKGSITPYSSFNAYCDPDAVDVVLKNHKKVPLIITTKETGTTCFFDEKQREKFGSYGKVGQFVYDLCTGYKDAILKPGQYALHDTCALLTIMPGEEYFTRTNVNVSINIDQKDPKVGQTVFTINPLSNISLLLTVDKPKVLAKYEEILKNTLE